MRMILAFFGGIFTLVTMGVLFVAMGIGGIFWIYGRDLPSHESLAQYAPPTISRIYSGEGRMIDEFAEERRIFAPIEDIPELIQNAFVSAEDKNFWTHKGYDPMGMLAAARDAAMGKRLRGASTITQQVMKNFLLSSDRSAERKVKELILASRLEASLTKPKILELYLNEIFLGQNSFGVAAASQTYFNKPLSDLDAAEAATLASFPQAPSDLHPVRAKKQLTQRRNYVLREMFQNGYIDEATYRFSVDEPLKSVQNGDYEPFRAQLPPRDYFTDEIRRQLSRDFGEEEFFGGGLTIRATVVPAMQDEAAAALRAGLERFDRNLGVWRGTGRTIPADKLGTEADWRAALAEVKVARDIAGWHPAVVLATEGGSARIGIEGVAEDADGHFIPAEDVTWARKRQADGKLGPKAKKAGDLVSVGDVVFVRAMTKDADGSFIRWTLRQIPEVQGAFMAMDVETGRVIAMQGGFSYQNSVFNRATQATRQPGSTFKPFVYAAALDSGFTPATIIIDAPIEVNTPQGVWRPQNAGNSYYGPAPLRTGIEQSRNLMTVRLAQEVGMDTIAGYAERFGVYDRMNRVLAAALGSDETTLFRMVSAYAMFANGGRRVEPTLVDRVQDRWGKTIYKHDQRLCEDCAAPRLPAGLGPTIVSNRERMIDPITAYQLTSMLEGVVQRGTAAKAVNLPVPVAGKTGTTNDAKDVWFIGFTSNVVAGCYIGYDRPRSMGGASGGGICAPVFQQFMSRAVKTYGGGKFDVPPGGHFIKIDRFSGARLSDDASGPNVVAEYFRDGEDPVFGIAYDGGFAMGVNLPLIAPDGGAGGIQVETATGGTAKIPKKATFGSLSAGGLY
jgi:penicillin-binding protein 1A